MTKTSPAATTPADAPEEQAISRSLAALVREELERAFGARNAEVFRPSAREDLSVEVISSRVELSTARVHAILAQSRRHLREHEHLRRWHEPPTT